MRDFRLPNVLTCHGIEGEYVVVDMESAGPDCTEWPIDPLNKWNAKTLNVRAHDTSQKSSRDPVTRSVSTLIISLSLIDCLN